MTAKVKFCTDSVIAFLKENTELVRDYVQWSKGSGFSYSYSGMLKYGLNGTTAEDVDFSSIYVERKCVTEFLLDLIPQLGYN